MNLVRVAADLLLFFVGSNGSSLIEYVIVSEVLLKNFTEFYVSK